MMKLQCMNLIWTILSLTCSSTTTMAFVSPLPVSSSMALAVPHSSSKLSMTTTTTNSREEEDNDSSMPTRLLSTRREWWSTTTAAAAAATSLAFVWGTTSSPAVAATTDVIPLEDALYLILRVREATQQETRLITSGKFKDVQRANVKLAVGMMVTNYKLSDMINTAAAYIPDSTRSFKAITTGQTAVQNLQTILEYFDSSDVQNLKVNQPSMSGEKEQLVLKGLESAKLQLDSFLTFFPNDVVDTVKDKIRKENELNQKEFDSVGLGTSILNLSPTQTSTSTSSTPSSTTP